MKIVYSLEHIGFSGGVERVICTKANYFADVLGYEIHIVVASSNPESLFYVFSNKIQIHYLNIIFKRKKPWDFIHDIDREYKKKLEAKLNEIEPDITISTFGRDANFLYQLKDGSKKILEFHFTKNYLKHLGQAMGSKDKLRFIRKYWLNYLSWKDEQIAKHYKYIVVLTKRDKLLWGGEDKFTVIPNPLSFRLNTEAKLNNKRIVAIGRLNREKGFDLLMRSFKLIEKEFLDWHIDIYGKGMESCENYLHELRKELALEDVISFKNSTNQVEDVLLEASILAFPSRYDGFGLVITEAMECGVPSIAFDCDSGPGEIIKSDCSGILVPKQDIVLFAESLRKLMLNKDLRIEMGMNAKREVARFYPENIMPLWIELFNKVIK